MASRGINKAIILGNLGNDPETRHMNNGNAVTNFTIATSESWKDKATGQQQERTEWHRVSTFGKLAEICGQYLKKGSKVYIEGEIRTRQWEDNTGNKRSTTEIVANEMQMLDSKPQGGGQQPQQNYQQPHQQQQPQQNYQQPRQQQQPQQNYQQPQQSSMDDEDIPF